MLVNRTLSTACDVLRSKVRYETAYLHLPSTDPCSPNSDTVAIREATRLYVETWIVPIIDAIQDGDMTLLRDIIGL